MPEPIPNFVGQAQAVAPWIVLALLVTLALLAIENWPEKPNQRR